MDPVGRNRFGVLAVGAVAASLILWLSVSFWLDAWRQREDARHLRRGAQLDRVLIEVGLDAARERAATLALLGGGTVTRAADTLSRAELEALRASIDARLDASLATIAAAIEEPALAGRLRHSANALRASIDALEDARRALAGQRRASAWPLTDADAAASPATRQLAAWRGVALGTAVIERLHALQDGFRIESRTAVRPIEELERLRIDARDFVEHATRAALTPDASTAPRAALDRLGLHERDRAIGPDLLDRLGALAGAGARGPAAASDIDALVRHAAALDAGIARDIADEIATVEAHAHRRLAIDTLLIGVCFWIVLASLRLLRNIQHQAWHDRLTGLPNRFRFEHLLTGELAAARERGSELAVAVIDVDGLGSINDSLGHAMGDALLGELARRLDAALPAGCTLASLGGDEFAAVVLPTLPGGATPEIAHGVAERLRGACATPFDIDGATLRVTLCVGVARSDAIEVPGVAAETASGLLGRATVAMRQAKDDGPDRVRLFDRALAERNRERLDLERDLRHAIERDELELHYQPKVGIRTARVDGLEALVRWHHPERGSVPPGVFVPVAERCGLIGAIGAWVLDEAVRQTALWHRDGRSELQVAVNVSADQFAEPGFVADVERTLGAHGLPARRLELEVTESVGMMDVSIVVDRLERLRASGVSIALDDFGTDYSSLQYLEALPLDTLKIDRAFVSRLDGGKGRSLVRTIVMMARSLELKTVAEGVETSAQLEQVVALGCDHVQGYHYSRPVPAAEVPATIARIESDLDGGSGDGLRRAA